MPRNTAVWPSASVMRGEVDDHTKYGMLLDLSAFGISPPFSEVRIFPEDFIEYWFEQDHPYRAAFLRYIDVIDFIEYGASYSLEGYYGNSARVFVELSRDDEYTVYSLFGFGCYEAPAIRQFAKDNFHYYRLNRTDKLGMTHVPSWTIKIETQELSFRELTGTLMTADEFL